MKQRSVNQHDFSMIPRAEIPRSSFRMEKALKTAFSFGYLVPILVEEVLPGDTWSAKATIVARTAVPIVPVMDNWHLETFAFFVPNRLTWANWVKFMGEQTNPGDSISYTIPQVVSPVGGYAANSVFDYMGLPTVGQVQGAATITHSALPLRAHNLIINQWFRDENLVNSQPVSTNDGPDVYTNFGMVKRGKRHDYFTSALPWPQKGNTAVSLPLGSSATVIRANATATPQWQNVATTASVGALRLTTATAGTANVTTTANPVSVGDLGWGNSTGLITDLSTATAATINQIRQAFQIQRLLERDARGGTRYTEIVRSHFGVVSPDARLQRPEYIGGGRNAITTNAIPQTSATGLTGGTTPAGNLAATGHAQGTHGFTYAATEHGYIIMYANARADLTYQQGMRKMWSKSTRYDFYFPVFAMLGEQAILNREIFCDGSPNDANVFGYQERWAEYRYNPSQITGLMRSTTAGNISYWHSAQQFGSLPTLNNAFIEDTSDVTLQRNFAGGASTANQQLVVDALFTFNLARLMPMYSVPGNIDRF